MSEELLQRDLIRNPEKIGNWYFYNIGSTSLRELKNAGIIPKKDYKNFERRKPDGIITSSPKEVIAIVENKDISQFKTKKQKNEALQQGLDVAQALNAKILILTDTVDTIWINAFNGKEILDEKDRPLKITFDPKNQDIEKLITQIIDCISKDNSKLKEPRLKDPTKLAKSVWQDLHIADGATPENCLYTFVEIFVFKYLSDLGILESPDNYEYLMSLYTIKKSNDYVLEYYSSHIRVKIKKLFPANISGDKTTIINGTIFVNVDGDSVYPDVFRKILEKFGNEKDGGGEFKNIIKDFKSKLFETFLKESISKKNWGQFFTPIKVVNAIVNMAKSEIKKGIIICDPACGVGKFILEPLFVNGDIKEFFRVENGKIVENIHLIGIDKGFDKNEQKTIILAKANMLIYFSDLIRENISITKEFSDLFNKTMQLKTKSVLGTLDDVSYENKIDLILTNPPYVTNGSSSLKQAIVSKGLSHFYKINAMGVEGLFMEWIIRSLTPGGKAFVVVPDGIFNRQNDKNLRQFILDECFIDGIISLPLKTFFTTSKKTYILCITKKKNNAEKQTEPVFTYLVSEIGESRDIYRFDIEQDDLNEAVNWFNQFKNAKKSFKFNDKRCKIQPIEKFNPETHWSIERWWSKEEQIELGIVEENKIVKFEELPSLLDEISTNLLNFKDELLELTQKKKTNLNFQEVFIGDIFDFHSTNSKVTKTFCNANIGSIPVYASSKDGNSVLGHIKDNLPNIKYYEDCLSWNRNGSVGYVFIRNNRFTTNEDHRALVIKEEFKNYLSKEYLKFIIEINLLKNGFSFLNKCGLNKIQMVTISIPVNKNMEFDIDTQNELVLQLRQSKILKQQIEEYKKQIEDLNIEVKENYNYKTEQIGNLFKIEKGKSIYTNEFIVKNKGVFPLYSSQTTNDGVIGNINIFDYDCEAITWTTDGIHAGTVFLRNGKFSMTTHCGTLILKSDIKNIYLDYIYFYLKNTLKQFAVGEQNKRVTTAIIKPIGISIPINSKGEFDLSFQQEIAGKYRKIEQIKQSISEELDKILNIDVSFG